MKGCWVCFGIRVRQEVDGDTLAELRILAVYQAATYIEVHLLADGPLVGDQLSSIHRVIRYDVYLAQEVAAFIDADRTEVTRLRVLLQCLCVCDYTEVRVFLILRIEVGGFWRAGDMTIGVASRNQNSESR